MAQRPAGRVDVLTLFVALGILIGLVGVVLPLLPGLLLVWASVVTWAVLDEGPWRWQVVIAATVLVAASQILKYLLPGRRLRRAGVATGTLLVGALVGIVGFFVVPVIGLVLGFVGGVYLAEYVKAEHLSPTATWGTQQPTPWIAHGDRTRPGSGLDPAGRQVMSTSARARAATALAVRAVGLAIMIELAAGLLVAAMWILALVLR